MEKLSLNCHHPEVAALLCSSEGVREPDPDVPPMFLADFPRSWGRFLTPSNFPIPSRDPLAGEAPCSTHLTHRHALSSCADTNWKTSQKQD